MTEQQQLDIINLIEEQLIKKRKELSKQLLELSIKNDERIMCNNILYNKELYKNVDSIEIQNIVCRRKVESYEQMDKLKTKLKEEINETYLKIQTNRNMRKSVVENYKALKDLENNEQIENNSI